MEPKSITFKELDQIAGEFRDKADEVIGFTNNVSDFLAKIVKALGGTISILKNPAIYEANGGSLVIQPDGRFQINLSPVTSPLRDNFTIAHELGHYFLHYDRSKKEVQTFARYGNNKQEIEANRFAAAFLMPKPRFEKAMKDFNNSVLLIAAKFQVSESAVRVRMESINK